MTWLGVVLRGLAGLVIEALVICATVAILIALALVGALMAFGEWALTSVGPPHGFALTWARVIGMLAWLAIGLTLVVILMAVTSQFLQAHLAALQPLVFLSEVLP